MKCLRCGAECNATYCDSCGFYELNMQCWRCRMYLPKVELQQFRGQTYCPYCIMEIRDEERKHEEVRSEEAKKTAEKEFPPEESGTPTGIKNPDYVCDKCRDDLDIVYVVADHKFCELCFHQLKKEWKDSNIPPQPYMKFKVKEGPGLFMKFLKFLKRKIREEWERRSKKRGRN